MFPNSAGFPPLIFLLVKMVNLRQRLSVHTNLAVAVVLVIGVSKCLRRKQWADETPFEVVGTSEAGVEAPRRARQNASKQVSSNSCFSFRCGRRGRECLDITDF